MLATDRLILRPHAIEDHASVYRLATDWAVTQFIRGLPGSREEAWHRLLRYAGHWSLFGFGMFAVLQRSSGSFIGEVGFAHFQRGLGMDFDEAPEAAWLFEGASHGQGFAQEAMTAALGWFDGHHCARRCVCIIDPGNGTSIKLAERLGFNQYDAGRYREANVGKYERIRT